eukprot:6204369-Pleurochrysis_carterae.AAC.4
MMHYAVRTEVSVCLYLFLRITLHGSDIYSSDTISPKDHTYDLYCGLIICVLLNFEHNSPAHEAWWADPQCNACNLVLFTAPEIPMAASGSDAIVVPARR